MRRLLACGEKQRETPTMNSSFRQSSWIVTPCLGAIAVAYLTLVWLPNRRAIKEWRDEVEAKQQLVAQGTGLSASLSASEQELDKARSLAAQWEKAAPGKRDIPALYGRVNAMAKEAGLSISRFDPQAFKLYEKLQEIPITVVGSGTYAQVFEFLRLVEGLPVTVWVESMRLERTVQNAKAVQCELTLAVFSNNQQNSDYAKHSE
jgi:Tfp pilus assembly protein PilO